MTTRTRLKGSINNVQYDDVRNVTARFGGCSNPLTTITTDYSASEPVGTLRVMTDVVTKGFRTKQARGEIVMNPLETRVITFNPAVSSARIAYHANSLQCSGASEYRTLYDFPACALLSFVEPRFRVYGNTWALGTALGQPEVEHAVLEASTRCQSERGRPPVNFWETVAERKQSYALLAQYMAQLKEITLKMQQASEKKISLPRKLLRMKGHALQATAGAWLISRYGLLPLIKDIRSLMMQLKTDQTQEVRHTSRSKAVVGRTLQSFSNHTWDNDFTFTVTGVLTDEVTVRAMSLDEWKLTTLDHFGLGTKDLVTLPWELVTLSFVADWIVNIGDFIGALVPTPGVKQLGSCIVTTRTRSLTCTADGFTPYGVADMVTAGPLTKTGTLVEKSRNPGLRAPSLIVLNRSKIDPDLDKNRMRIVDAAALCAQRIGRVALNLSYAKF